MTSQVTLPFLKMIPKTIKILEMTPQQNGRPPSQVINDQPLSSILYLLWNNVR